MLRDYNPRLLQIYKRATSALSHIFKTLRALKVALTHCATRAHSFVPQNKLGRGFFASLRSALRLDFAQLQIVRQPAKNYFPFLRTLAPVCNGLALFLFGRFGFGTFSLKIAVIFLSQLLKLFPYWYIVATKCANGGNYPFSLFFCDFPAGKWPPAPRALGVLWCALLFWPRCF